MQITILKWSEFNGRRDVKRPTWFRVDHDIFENPKLYDLGFQDWGGVLYLLCHASKANCATFNVHFSHAERVAQLPEKYLRGVIRKLEQCQFVRVDVTGANANVTGTIANVPHALQTWPLQDIQDIHTHTHPNTHGADKESLRADARERSHPLLKIWNENRGPLAEAKELNAKRAKHAIARWREKPDPEFWTSVVQRIAASPFCRGSSDSGWRATFDYLIKPDTATKVTEGMFDSREKAPKVREIV